MTSDIDNFSTFKDCTLIKFRDHDPEGEDRDNIIYAKFRHSLSEDQVKSIDAVSKESPYDPGIETLANWVEAVIELARKDDSWKNDTKNTWEFWVPDLCLTLEVFG